MASIKDVAKHCGTAISTVSHVINGTKYVSPELEARIRAAIAELGYEVNPVARSLKSRRSYTVGVIITNIDRTLNELEGGTKMTDQEKFEGFKQAQIDENEAKYGEEIRAKYGEETVERSYRSLKGMTEAQYKAQEALGGRIIETLLAAQKTGDPAGPLAQEAAGLHRQWLEGWWGWYTAEAHAGIAQMYVDDSRFTAHYDQHSPGLAAFLRDAVHLYTGQAQR